MNRTVRRTSSPYRILIRRHPSKRKLAKSHLTPCRGPPTERSQAKALQEKIQPEGEEGGGQGGQGTNRYECSICNGTLHKDTIVPHMWAQHRKRATVCGVCGAVLHSQGPGRHLATHRPANFGCAVCGATYRHRRTAETHAGEEGAGPGAGASSSPSSAGGASTGAVRPGGGDVGGFHPAAGDV
ncbi:hypothetical protein VMCG_00734 [Cytospora schulzeri]|uniref:C2H2-type domain-containing protein n=1 Tax=Cytospora schulzeri TaxID=448051 RepID=A0A423X9P3_9PEZI|nr:hypothetical protein VMCG_00734 [Valsa malicola]